MWLLWPSQMSNGQDRRHFCLVKRSNTFLSHANPGSWLVQPVRDGLTMISSSLTWISSTQVFQRSPFWPGNITHVSNDVPSSQTDGNTVIQSLLPSWIAAFAPSVTSTVLLNTLFNQASTPIMKPFLSILHTICGHIRWSTIFYAVDQNVSCIYRENQPGGIRNQHWAPCVRRDGCGFGQGSG